MVSHYNAINMFAMSLVLLYNLCHIKQKRSLLSSLSRAAIQYFQPELPPKRRKQKNQPKQSFKLITTTGFWSVIETCVLFLAQCGLGLIFNNLVGRIFDTGLNYFGTLFVVPLAIVALCLAVKIDPLAQLDLITPSFSLSLIFTKIACLSAGCCRGMEWERGWYNPFSRQIEFPSPLLESSVALLLFVFLFCLKKKFKKGTVFPVYLIAYSAIRFFTEFLRHEPNVLWGLKAYHFFCIAGVVVGVIEYWVVRKYDAWIQKNKDKKS